MSITNKILITIIALMLVFFGITKCSENKDAGLQNYMSEKDTAYAVIIKGISASYNKALAATSEKQAKLMLAKNDTLLKLISGLKKLTNTLVIKERIAIEKDTILFTDTIPCNFKPIQVKRYLPHYSFFGHVTNKELLIDSLFIPNTQSIVMGEKKVNFWGKSEQGVFVQNSNPLIKTSFIQALTIKENKKLIERPLFWATITALAGFILGTQTK